MLLLVFEGPSSGPVMRMMSTVLTTNATYSWMPPMDTHAYAYTHVLRT